MTVALAIQTQDARTLPVKPSATQSTKMASDAQQPAPLPEPSIVITPAPEPLDQPMPPPIKVEDSPLQTSEASSEIKTGNATATPGPEGSSPHSNMTSEPSVSK
jgi:hypothetical protein